MLNTENKILDNLGVKSLRIADEGFPLSLTSIIDAPKKLHYIGDIELLNEANNIAIVGARNADLYAKHFTNSLVKALSLYPAVIVSGGAKGIDMTAHVAALENSMPTIIVLGSGILASQFDMNSFFIKKLRETKGSLIISEFEPFAPAQRWTFAYRNRLIAALSRSTVLIQAAKESGSLITAKYALKYKKNLFAFSAQGLNPNFAGNYELLESGKAKSLNSAEDVIFQQFPSLIRGTLLRTAAEPASSSLRQSQDALIKNTKTDALLALIESGIHSFEHLKIKAEINPTTLSMLLSMLEVKGKIGRAINGEFFRIAG
jgi:DNA processing protein